ncbi:exonuclease I, putative [Plasmodium berghei]|uniref:Exonuclease 1 n=2 Tax=Plasmodium berghei TaxID=5821 RepID=A0A509AJE4_PLABA|nr:exonuclease I, putative [Plasmodium berghei ANKA]CXI20846.1 exonuclease I, putative [Plasmodium berghei]SCM20003.1 exonuclease I, putative [Plasmodium berghei]SCN23692.1 exonuclease I, putative [Plasmodium berghei]SCO59211.1 exonuclease I, putative [Plasmodium berghei]SCO60024.1 exonuclease I, putative [Plasmodium berghei]|eukprot:XP_034420725.1 exonuclease I, putative [Plasmodium berghei ANKA]
MGISNLLQFLKPIVKNTHISKYQNGIVGVDIMCWIHRGLIGCAFDVVTDNHNENYLSFIEKMLEAIYQYNIKVIFVFDGEELPEKKKENLIRKARREKAKDEALEIIKKVKNPRSNELVIKKCIQAITVSKEIIQSVINFCKKKNIYYIISPYEADAQLSYLCRMGFISCAISEDSDLLVYGCPRVLYKFKNTGECNEITLMPINDLIDSDIINKIKNPISNSFNQFYITPIKNIQNEESNFSDSFISNEEKQSHTFSRKRRRNLKNEKRKKKKRKKNNKLLMDQIYDSKNKQNHNQNSNNLMKTYINNFYWPEELYKLKYFNLDMFLAMCILSGCDYTNDFHISGMGIKTAFNLIYEHKTIQNIFSFLISHNKWKNKIPPNLDSLDKLMEKYNEIKNAFLQHHVYDFILNKIIPIHHSFQSFFKKETSNLLCNSDNINNRFKLYDDVFVHKIIESSLFLDFSKINNKCLNNSLDDLTNQKDDDKNIEIIKDYATRTQLLKSSTPIPLPFPNSPFNNKEEIINQHNIDNIFKNFTSECFEYLEISPGIVKRHKQINLIDSKYDKNTENDDNKSELNFINKKHKTHINIKNNDHQFSNPPFLSKLNTFENYKFMESISNQNDQIHEQMSYDQLDKKNKQMKSAKNLYENMKKTFTLFKTLGDKEEIKHDLKSPQKNTIIHETQIQDPKNFLKKNDNYIKSENKNEMNTHSFIPPLNRSKLHIKKKNYNGQLKIANFFKNSNKDELINSNNNTHNHFELKSDQNTNHIYNSPNKLKQIETDGMSTDQDRDIHNENTTCKDVLNTDWKNTKNFIHSSKFTQNNSNTSPNKTQENDKNINLDYMLQNLNYNYQPKIQKLNTFDYFKEKENAPNYNPYIDNIL